MFCQFCGNEEVEKFTRIPFIAKQGIPQKLYLGDEKKLVAQPDIPEGTGQKWESINVCLPCTKKYVELLTKSLDG
jgi:hypothetical protein